MRERLHERRRHRRKYLPRLYARVNGSIEARVLDISPYGLRLEALTALRPAASCHISLPCDAGTLRFRARITRCRAKSLVAKHDDENTVVYHAGVDLAELSEQNRRALVAVCQQGVPVEQPKRPPTRLAKVG